MLTGTDTSISSEHLVLEHKRNELPVETDLNGSLWAEEMRRIVEALRLTGGNRKLAAQNLAVSPRTLRYKLARIRESGVEVPGDKLEVSHG